MKYSTAYLLFCSFFGFVVFMVFSWQEWRKLTGRKMSLREFITEDYTGFWCAVVLTVASYIALPELAGIAVLRDKLGFAPQRTPLGAMASSFAFSVLGYQFRSILLKRKEAS